MKVSVVYNNIKDKELLDKINLEVPFFIDYIDSSSAKGKKEAYRLKSHWGARKEPFIELLDDNNKVEKVFYSEDTSAINQLINYLNGCKNQEIK